MTVLGETSEQLDGFALRPPRLELVPSKGIFYRLFQLKRVYFWGRRGTGTSGVDVRVGVGVCFQVKTRPGGGRPGCGSAGNGGEEDPDKSATSRFQRAIAA